jgi:hypothetical protein
MAQWLCQPSHSFAVTHATHSGYCRYISEIDVLTLLEVTYRRRRLQRLGTLRSLQISENFGAFTEIVVCLRKLWTALQQYRRML